MPQRDYLVIVIGPNVIFFITLLISLILVSQLNLPWFLFSGLITHEMTRVVELILGQVLMILCVGLITWGVASIGVNRARGNEIGKQDSSLITTGVYEYSRHPITLGFALGSFGIALVFDFIPLLVNAVVFTPIMIGLLFYEERELLNRFGEEYETYRRLTHFLIPRRKKS